MCTHPLCLTRAPAKDACEECKGVGINILKQLSLLMHSNLLQLGIFWTSPYWDLRTSIPGQQLSK